MSRGGLSTRASELGGEMLPEGVPPGSGRALRRLRLLRTLPADMLRQLPLLLRVRRGMKRTRDVSALLRSLTPDAGGRVGTPAERERLVRAMVWLTRLLPVNPRGDCLFRSLAIYAALRRRGWPAVFVTGVRREPSGVVGHAWVELDRRAVAEVAEPENGRRYRESLRYPPGGERETLRGGEECFPAGAAPARGG